MRKRAGFGMKRLAAVCGALGVLALVPQTATAVTSPYHPDTNARTFGTSVGGWQGSANYPGLCGLTPGVLCPAIDPAYQSSGGASGGSDGFIRTGLSGLAATVATTSSGVWQSPSFTYVGAGGVQPQSLSFSMVAQANVTDLLAIPTNSVKYSVQLVDQTDGSGTRTLIPSTDVPTAANWTGVGPVNLAPGDLQLGHVYRFRISTAYETVADLIPTASVDYDNVALVAQAPGKGAGSGGGVAGGGLASKTAVMKGDKLQVKVRCGRAVQGRCKVKLVGLWKKQGPRVTKLKKVFVRHGTTKKVNLKLRPRAVAAVATRNKIWVAIKVNANGFKTLKIKKLNLRVQN